MEVVNSHPLHVSVGRLIQLSTLLFFRWWPSGNRVGQKEVANQQKFNMVTYRRVNLSVLEAVANPSLLLVPPLSD